MSLFKLNGTISSFVTNADYVTFPKLTQLEIDALTNISEGSIVFNITLNLLQIHNGTLWESMFVSNVPANTIRLNPTNASNYLVNFSVNPNSLIGRDITGNIINYPITNLLLSNSKLGNILFVSSQADVTNNAQSRIESIGRIDRPFRNIQNACNVALDGDTIYIYDGIYTENISYTSKNLVFIINKCTINGSWDISALNVKIIGLSEKLSILSHTSSTHFICSSSLSIEIENLRIISTGQITFNKPIGESGYVYSNNCNITCDTFMNGSWYHSTIKNSQIIANTGSCLVVYLGETFIINSYIESQNNCFITIGNIPRFINVLNSTLYSKNGNALGGFTSVGGSLLNVDNSRIISDTSSAIYTNGSLFLLNTKIKSTNISGYILSSSEFINVVSTSTLVLPSIAINVSQNTNFAFYPDQYKIF